MIRTRTLLTAVLLVAAAAGCGWCDRGVRKGGATDVRRFLPKNAELAVVVPELGVVGDRIQQLQRLKLASFVAQLQGFAGADAFADALVRQLGVDVRSREALRNAGLAPDRALGVAVLGEGAAFAVVPVSDPKAFRETLGRIARDRLGAPAAAETAVGEGRTGVTFSRASGPAELGYVLVDGFALVAAGAQVAKLGERAALPEDQSLAKDAQLESSLGRLPKERDAVVHVPSGRVQGSVPPLVGGTAVVRLEPSALRAWVDVPWPDSEATLNAFEKKQADDLSARLPRDAFFIARFNGDPTQLQALWAQLGGAQLQHAFQEAKIDVQQDVLANFHSGMVASLSVSPSIPLGSGMPELDVRRTNPFRYVHFVAVARGKDRARIAALLARLPEVAPRFGARVEPMTRGGQTLFITRYAQGEGVHFAQAQDDRVILASPLARLERAVLNPGDGGAPILSDAEISRGLGEHALSAVLDLDQLRASVKALPQDAWGIGGFAIKASAVRWLEATDDLRAITAGLSRREKALQAEIALRFTPK
ncbi:MAG TPA: hypothetical protein VE549_03465 [Myxococcaceae bacterium]|nr:hypothetical protein [Myxococcaceae bacterium]